MILMGGLMPRAVQARSDSGLLSLDAFVALVENGEAETLRGVYVPEVLASEVVQQPVGDATYVSSRENTLTQFQLTSRFASIGLLAHDYLAGKTFFLLTKGQKFYLIYGDGRTETFVVIETLRYRALQPYSVKSEFLDLTSGRILTTSKLFTKIYNRPDQVILQTCIYANETPSWGRLFVIARPTFSAKPPIGSIRAKR